MQESRPESSEQVQMDEGSQKHQIPVGDLTTIPMVPLSPCDASLPGNVNLSSFVQHMMRAGLTRLQEPQPEELDTHGLNAVKPAVVLGKLAIVSFSNAFGLLVIACSYSLSVLHFANFEVEFVFLLGLLCMFVPNIVRLLSSASSRVERLCLLCFLGIALFLAKFMISPLYSSSFDDTMHWRTAEYIFRTRHLFFVNSMLPVSSYYPGLEIVTNALSTISHLNTFTAGVIVLSASRLLMNLSLFLFYEQLTKSSRMAGIASMIYMANPHFLFFDASYSYETLALPLATFMLYILLRYQNMDRDYRWILFSAWMVLLAVTMTHHMTDFVLDGLLILWTAASLFQATSHKASRHLATLALFGVLASVAYALIKGNPVWSYLYDYFNVAFKELGQIIAGTSTARRLFTTSGIVPAPIWDRLLMTASVGLVLLGLPFGLFVLRQQHRHNALAVTFGITSLAYPITQVFRFTDFGVEITDRASAFLFLPIAYVLTILITNFWPTRKLNWRGISLITCTLSVIFLGSVIIESGPALSSLPGPYTVVADARSFEPEGIQDATWALTNLGPNNRIGTDRINQMLMNTFGEQRIVTNLNDKVDISSVFFSSQLGPREIAILRSAKIHYLVVDLRLTSALPLQGYYFESDEADAFHLTSPIRRAALMKFDTIPQINRVFDSGDIVIYDVSALVNGS